MTRDMQLQRLAPKPQTVSIAAVAGLAKFYGCAPDHLSPDQIRASLHHVLVERHLAWSSWNQVACGLQVFSVTPLGWAALHLHLPPRTGRRLLPHRMSVEALQRLCTSAAHPRHRALLMITYAAGRRVGEVVRLRRTDLESDRRLSRVKQGKGRKDRSTQPLSIATAQKLSYHAKRVAGITHGKGIHTLRHGLATHLLEAGGDLHTIQLLRGHRTIDTTTRYLHITRRHLAQVHSPLDRLGVAEGLPSVATECGHASRGALPPCRGQPARP